MSDDIEPVDDGAEAETRPEQATKPEPVPAGSDLYGRPASWVEPENAEAAEHWDAALWRRSS